MLAANRPFKKSRRTPFNSARRKSCRGFPNREGDELMQEKMSQRQEAAFAWDDPFLFDDQLNEDERAIRDTARDYAQERLLPRVIDAYLNETTDRDIFRE